MLEIDFKEHNKEIKEMWEKFHAGEPYRTPIVFGINPRFKLLDPKNNKDRILFKTYFENPEVMFNIQLDFAYWVKHNILQDYELGVPEEGWTIQVDLQNVYESAWFGCPVKFYEDQVPDVTSILDDDNKRMLFDTGMPEPFQGIMELNLKYYEYFQKRAKDETFCDRPIKSCQPAALGTDGPFTIASNLRGATNILLDCSDDPEYVKELLGFITEATIFRLKDWWKLMGMPLKMDTFWFADDSIQNISTEMYKELVLPFHKKLLNELGKSGQTKIHLCGDSSRHFLTIRDELDCIEFDTGFPIDFGGVRKQLGKKVRLLGGPSIQLLRFGSKEEIEAETKRILLSGVTDGGNFILREGNNLAPLTPLENIKAMYYAGREFGKY
jgi:uroporphyrinogen-III decarboxylase